MHCDCDHKYFDAQIIKIVRHIRWQDDYVVIKHGCKHCGFWDMHEAALLLSDVNMIQHLVVEDTNAKT